MKVLLSLTLVLTWLERCGGSGWVFTEPQLQASTGDSVLLQCCFRGLENKDWTVAKVDWLYKAGAGTQEEMVFYYYSHHDVPVGRFKERVQWQGNISHRDGSIQLRDLHVNDSGTYECEIRLFLNSNIFKNHTVLHVSPPVQNVSPTVQDEGRGVRDAVPSRDSGFWPAVVGCGSVAMVVAFLAGLCVRKRFAANTALEKMGNSKNKAEEALYCSIPGAEIPKAEQDAKKKRRAEDIYITMHPSHGPENGVYVDLSKRVIPAEWMGEGRQDDGQSEEPHSRPEEPLPGAPAQKK